MMLNEGFFRDFDTSRNIETYEFVAFDTELTGLDPHRDEMVSIAAVRIRGMRIVLDESFSSLIRPRKRLFGEGTFVHRITPEEIRQAPDPEDVIPKFVDFCGHGVLVGHLPELDFVFLDKASERVMGALMRNPCLDSMELARAHREFLKKHPDRALPPPESLNLTELSRAYGIPLFPGHDALSDSLQTAYLFLYLVEALKRFGLTTFKDFYRMGRAK